MSLGGFQDSSNEDAVASFKDGGSGEDGTPALETKNNSGLNSLKILSTLQINIENFFVWFSGKTF